MNQQTKARLARQPYVVYASYNHSTWELSNALRALRVTHTIQPPERGSKCIRVNMKRPQPRDVHIVSDLIDLRPDAINFMVASFSELSLMNIPLVSIGTENLDQRLRTCLHGQVQTMIQLRSPSPVDYINMIARPSLLNKIQTEILKIVPYTWRKEVQDEVVRYFNSRTSKRAIVKFLNRSLKLEPLKILIKGGDELRNAVALLAESDAETVSAKTGVPAFDISYFASAGRKLDQPAKTKAKKEK